MSSAESSSALSSSRMASPSSSLSSPSSVIPSSSSSPTVATKSSSTTPFSSTLISTTTARTSSDALSSLPSSTIFTSSSSTIPPSSTSFRHTNTVPITTTFQTTVVGTSNGVAFTTVFSTTSVTPAGDVLPQSSNGKTSAKVKAVVGGVVGSLLALGLILLALFFFLRHRRQKRATEQFDGNFDPAARGSTVTSARASTLFAGGRVAPAEGGTLPAFATEVLEDDIHSSNNVSHASNEKLYYSSPVMTGISPVMTGSSGSSSQESPLQPQLYRRSMSPQQHPPSAFSNPSSPLFASAFSPRAPSEFSSSSGGSDSRSRFSVANPDATLADPVYSGRSITKDQRENYLRQGPASRDGHGSSNGHGQESRDGHGSRDGHTDLAEIPPTYESLRD
ncbi:hypothetical protein C8J56DRAFT_922248 [Mycena floridula]|nr:hypothetical protein C8J56DRAFT_922248 [Mycena floridula]